MLLISTLLNIPSAFDQTDLALRPEELLMACATFSGSAASPSVFCKGARTSTPERCGRSGGTVCGADSFRPGSHPSLATDARRASRNLASGALPGDAVHAAGGVSHDPRDAF